MDLEFTNHGSIFTIQPTSDAGRDWINKNVQSEDWQWLGDNLCVDHRLAADLAKGAVADGLEVA